MKFHFIFSSYIQNTPFFHPTFKTPLTLLTITAFEVLTILFFSARKYTRFTTPFSDAMQAQGPACVWDSFLFAVKTAGLANSMFAALLWSLGSFFFPLFWIWFGNRFGDWIGDLFGVWEQVPKPE